MTARWMTVAETGQVAPADHRGAVTTDLDESAFARTRGRSARLYALLVTGQHATDEATVTISTDGGLQVLAVTVPGKADHVLTPGEGRVEIGGPNGLALPGGFVAETTDAAATFVVWYDVEGD